jgi:hypothetical protein
VLYRRKYAGGSTHNLRVVPEEVRRLASWANTRVTHSEVRRWPRNYALRWSPYVKVQRMGRMHFNRHVTRGYDRGVNGKAWRGSDTVNVELCSE